MSDTSGLVGEDAKTQEILDASAIQKPQQSRTVARIVEIHVDMMRVTGDASCRVARCSCVTFREQLHVGSGPCKRQNTLVPQSGEESDGCH